MEGLCASAQPIDRIRTSTTTRQARTQPRGTRQALQGLQPCRPPKVLGPSRKIFFSSKRKKKKKICQTALPFPL